MNDDLPIEILERALPADWPTDRSLFVWDKETSTMRVLYRGEWWGYFSPDSKNPARWYVTHPPKAVSA